MNTKKLLIIEDDDAFSSTLSNALEKKGFTTCIADTIDNALESTNTFNPDFALLDLRLGKDSGLKIIPNLIEQNSNIKIVVLTAYASIATAVEAIKLGAIQYLTKPTSSDEIIQAFFKSNGGYPTTNRI